MNHTPYTRPVKKHWYLKNTAYKTYALREATSIFAGLWMLNLLFGLLRLSQGPIAWLSWIEWMQHPVMLVFSLVTLGMALFHTVTWFAIAPKAMPGYIAGIKINPIHVTLGHWAGFIVFSLFVFLFFLTGG